MSQLPRAGWLVVRAVTVFFILRGAPCSGGRPQADLALGTLYKTVYGRGEAIVLEGRSLERGLDLPARLILRSDGKQLDCGRIQLTHAAHRFQIDSTPLACGSYEVTLVGAKGEPIAVIKSPTFEVVPPAESAFAVLACGFRPGTREESAESLLDLKAHGVNTVVASLGYGFDEEPFAALLDEAAKLGLRVLALANSCHNIVPDSLKSESDMFTRNASNGLSQTLAFRGANAACPCPLSQEHRDTAGFHLRRIAAIGSQFCSFLGVSLDEDPSLGWHSPGGLNCYCKTHVERFRQVAGQGPPRWDAAALRRRYPRGTIVDDDDPWAEWNELRLDTFRDYHRFGRATVSRPARQLLTTSQLWRAPMVLGLNWRHFYEPLDLVFCHAYPGLRPVLTTAYTAEFARRTSGAAKPSWLTIQAQDATSSGDQALQATPAFVRQQCWLALSGGMKGIGFFPYNIVPKWAIADRPEVWQELGRVFRTIAPLSPLLLAATEEQAKLALLFPYSCELFEQSYLSSPAEAWLHWHKLEEVYCSLLVAGIPADIIFEQDLLDGAAAAYRALMLIDVDWMRRSVLRKIRAFPKRGRQLLVDGETEIALPECTKLQRSFCAWYELARGGKTDPEAFQRSLSSNAKYLRETLPPELRATSGSDARELVVRELQAGEARLLFAINNSKLCAGAKSGREIDAQIWTERQGVVHDVVRLCRVPTTSSQDRMAWQARIEPGDAGVYLIVPAELGSPSVQCRAQRGRTVQAAVRVADARGRAVRWPVPVRLTVKDPKGVERGHSQTLAVVGETEIELTFATNDPAGSWTVSVSEGISGKSASTSVPVGP